MVYLIYGSDLTQSRNFIGFIKSKFKNSQTKLIYAEKDFNFKELGTLVPTTSLFSESVLTIIEFEKYPSVCETKHLAFLDNLHTSSNVVLWIGENLNKTNILLKYAGANKNFIVKPFNKKNSTLNFELVDMLNIKNPKALVILNKILVKDSDAGLVLTILASNFRNILGVKLNCAFTKNLHPYVLLKIGKISKNFSEEELINILKRVYETDVKTKSNVGDVKSEMFSLVCHILN
ncbi:MAG: hypothetical protein ABIJ36_02385 [Patescibacteria group bacterium]